MTSTNIRKQFVGLFILSSIVISLLILLPFAEDPIKEYLSAFFMNVEKQLPKPKETPETNSNRVSVQLDNVNQNVINDLGNTNSSENLNNNGNVNGNLNSNTNQTNNSDLNLQTNANKAAPTPKASAKQKMAEPTSSPTISPTATPESIFTTKETQAIPTPLSELSIVILSNIFKLLKIILWFVLIIAILRFINSLIFSRALKNSNSYELTNLIRNVVMILLYIIAFFVIFQSQYPNIQLAPLFTGSTIVGIVVGFALQDTLGNLFAGLALQADQPFQIGDVIALGDKGKGVIENITWRGVKIRTFQNKLLIIGNSIIGKELIEVAPKKILMPD